MRLCRMAISRATASRMAARSCSHKAVEPSMSVKRKVTVPEGRSAMGPLLDASRSRCRRIVARGHWILVTQCRPADPHPDAYRRRQAGRPGRGNNATRIAQAVDCYMGTAGLARGDGGEAAQDVVAGAG